MPLLSPAQTTTTAVTIFNNSAREIKHVYFSPTDQDNWGPDQLNNTVISIGGSFTLSNVSCNAADIKVIAENEDGCFFYRIVSCGESGSWTIANDAAPDCGS
ncbi:MAG TPA: hypothetical protein DCK93_09630 [Blastocatellia bacterium]|jgi:hypothetical protein|nr:hypothetical protein [Blastocatellia bacterium]